jgi:pimeloyl-ACP methyl ester carboxylesterase
VVHLRVEFNPALHQPELAEIRKRLSDPIPVPAMHLHGVNDGCIGAETTAGMEDAFLKHFEMHIIPAAGHFVHQEQPDVVNCLIMDFLNKQLA